MAFRLGESKLRRRAYRLWRDRERAVAGRGQPKGSLPLLKKGGPHCICFGRALPGGGWGVQCRVSNRALAGLLTVHS